MKRLRKVLFALSMIFMFGLGMGSAKASVDDTWLDRDRFDGVYEVINTQNNTYLFKANRFLMNGITAYCIDPGVAINTDIYSSTEDWSIANLSNEVKQKVRLYAYYGYDYPGHQSRYYYMASQELIWETITGRDTYWVTDNYYDAPRINIENEKNEIINLVNNHYVTPSFDDTTLEVNMGDEITITDNNGVLNNYEIYSSSLNGVEINGNTLKIKSNNTSGENEIQFIKKNFDNKVTLIYYNGDNQKMASSGMLDPVIANITIKTTAGTITGNKLDIKTGSTPQGDATLNGAKYGIYNSNNELVDTLVIGTNNTSKTLPYGTYTVKELEASKGYTLSDKVETVTINSNNQNPTIDLYEKVISNKYEFHKILTSDLTSIIKAEKNIKFDVYLKSSNQLFTSFTTDENGKASIELPYGTYVVKQVNSTKNYRKVKDFEIVVNKDSNEEKSMLLTDNEITAKLKVIKIDADTGNVVKRENIKFKIKSLDTNEYVCQTISYPNTVEVCEYETDENGEFITPYPLHSGKYTLEEVDQKIDGYLWNKESKPFEIGENSKLITDDNGILFEVNFDNKEVKGKVNITKTGEEMVIEDGSYHYEKTNIDNVSYGLFANEDIKSADGTEIYKKNDLIGTYKIKNGKLSINDLYLGKYYLVEKTTDKNHVLDTTKHYFTIKYKDQYTPVVSVDLSFENSLKKGTIEFTKTDLVNGDVIPNTEIKIFTDKDEEIFKGITDENGKVIIDNLKIGKYYIIETEASTGYVITDEIVYFEIKENGEIVKAEMKNKQITGTVEITKQDISTSEPLPNTLIEVYNENDELVYSGRTDNEGKITIEDLKYGKYYFIEKEAPEGYTLNNEKMYFEILEDGKIVKATMVDEKEVIEVPNTLANIDSIIIPIGIITIGGLLFILSKRKDNK